MSDERSHVPVPEVGDELRKLLEVAKKTLYGFALANHIRPAETHKGNHPGKMKDCRTCAATVDLIARLHAAAVAR